MSDMFCIKCLDPDTLTRVESNSESTPLNSPKLIYPFSPRKISILNHLNRFLRVQHSTGVSVCLTDFTGFFMFNRLIRFRIQDETLRIYKYSILIFSLGGEYLGKIPNELYNITSLGCSPDLKVFLLSSNIITIKLTW